MTPPDAADTPPSEGKASPAPPLKKAIPGIKLPVTPKAISPVPRTPEADAGKPIPGAGTEMPRPAHAPTPHPHGDLLPSKLMEGVYDAMLECDDEGRIFAVNDRVARVLGYVPDELHGRPITGLISGFTPAMLHSVRNTLEPGHFTLLQAACRNKKGGEIPSEVAVCHLDVGGAMRLIFSIRKIDWRQPPPLKALPVEGNDQSKRYRELLRGLYDAVLITDLKGKIIDANARAQTFLQYGESELNALDIQHIVFGVDAAVLQRVQDHLADGRFTVLDAYCLRRDGSRFPAEIAISRIRLGGEGDLVFSIRNIERRRRTQEMLRTEHNAIQHSASGIVIADPKGLLQYANPAFLKLWGYAEAEDVLQKDIRDFFTEHETVDRLLTKALGGESWIGEWEAKTLKGRMLHLQASVSPNRDSADQPAGLVFSFVDITERKKAELAIRREAEAQIEQVREKQDFSGNLNILSVPDILQLIDATKKSGTLRVSNNPDGGPAAELTFLNGQVMTARSGDITGEAAVFALMRQSGSSFVFHQGTPTEKDASIENSTMGLILEGSRQLDETLATP